MSMDTKAALILAIGLILASLIHGGLYSVTSAGGDNQVVFRVNRFTGSTTWCVLTVCREPAAGSPIRPVPK